MSEVGRRYLRDLARAHASQQAVPETSYYPALERLLNGVGDRLAPGVTAVINIRDQGAGIPDGGLFAAHQLRRSGGPPAAFARQLPTHGVAEAKPADMELDRIVKLRQIARYLERYGKVLVTNFRQFQLLVQDDAGQPVRREPFSLADDEPSFWALASDPDPGLCQSLEDYLRRALLHGAQSPDPRTLRGSWLPMRKRHSSVVTFNSRAWAATRENHSQRLGLSGCRSKDKKATAAP